MRTLRAAWRGQKLVSAQGAAQVKEDWIERCGKALAALAAAYAPAINAETGPRIARGEDLKRVAEAFTTAERDIAAALGDIGDEAFRAAAARPFAQLREDAQRHLGALLAEDADRYWNEKVRARFTHDLAVYFPFIVSAEDADAKTVAAFFAPKSGALWDAERVLEAAAAITIAGKPLIRLGDGYRQALGAGKAVRDALFPSEAETPTLAFSAELRQRTGVFQALVAIGKDPLDLHESPEARRAFSCVLADPIACRVAIQVADGKWIEAASERRPWGLLRWAAGAAPSIEGSGRIVLTWTLSETAAAPASAGAPAPDAAAGKGWLIQLVVDSGPAVALFSRRVFDDLAFPAAIAVRSQEQ
jgi:type VI protein secretion system component VasK